VCNYEYLKYTGKAKDGVIGVMHIHEGIKMTLYLKLFYRKGEESAAWLLY